MEGLSMKDVRCLVEGVPPPPTLPAHGDGLDRDQPSRAEQGARADPDHPGVNTLGAIRWQLGGRITEERPAQNVLGDEPAQIVLLNEEFEAYVLELNSRCINIYQFQDPTGKDKRAAGNERTNRAYFVGADSMTGRPVVADGLAKSNRGNPPRLDANFTGAAFVGHHTKTVATAPIPHTNMLRGRNQMTFIKRLTLGDRYPRDGPVMPVPTQTELDTYLREEDEKWQLGWPLSVKTLDPMSVPNFQNLDPTAPNEWRYAYFYMMRIEGRDIPLRLIRAVDRFRQTLPRELLPLKFLVLMTFSYWAYIRFPVQTTEGFVGRSKLKSHQVPRVELATWLVYSPHFVRVHEMLGLALYQHPFRFTACHITSDVDFFGPEARVPTENIAEGEVLAIIDEMGITMADFEKVLPSSWPGTRLDWPGHHGLAPTPQHQRSLALPDVYLVGHPGYQVNTIPKQGRSQYRRKVVVPATMVPLYMASSNEIVRDQNLRALGTAVFAPYKTDYMRRYNQSAETPLFLTAPKLSVTRPYQTFRVGPDDAVDDVIEFPDANAHRMFLAYRNQRVPFEHLFHPRILQALIRHQRTALNAALNRGIGTDQLAVTPHGLVDWPGLERIDPNLADEVPEMILTYYADEITKRLALAVRSQVRVADILVGFDAMLSWDGIHNTKNSHQVPANRMDEPVGYAEHQAAMEAERIRAEQRAAEQRESNAEHQAEAEARENSAEQGEAELRDDDVEMMDGTDWQAAQPRQQSPQASEDVLSGPDFEAAQARFQRLRPDDDDIYDATPRLSTHTPDRSVQPESPHHNRHQEDGDEDIYDATPRLSTHTPDRSVQPESPHHNRHQEDGDEDIYDATPPGSLSTHTPDRSVQPESPHHNQHQKDGDEDMEMSSSRLSTSTLDQSVEPESPHHDRPQEDGDQDMEMSSPPFAMIPRRAGSLPPVLVTQGQLSLEDAIRELTTGPVTSARRVNSPNLSAPVYKGFGFGAHRRYATTALTSIEADIILAILSPVLKEGSRSEQLSNLLSTVGQVKIGEAVPSVVLGHAIGAYLGYTSEHTTTLRLSTLERLDLTGLGRALMHLLGIGLVDPTRPEGRRDVTTIEDFIRVLGRDHPTVSDALVYLQSFGTQLALADGCEARLELIRRYPWRIYLDALTTFMNHCFDLDIDARHWQTVIGGDYSALIEQIQGGVRDI